ncbi:MAG: hypothetical protein K2L12_06300 [Clostridia bacterium]|nr:hypothetical protein [Clostridia bacterium]
MTLKGKVDIGKDLLWWELGNIKLNFSVDIDETLVTYYHCKRKSKYIGHMHLDNCDLINLINDINSENKMVKITVSFLGSTFDVIDKNIKKKKSWFLVRRYYSVI